MSEMLPQRNIGDDCAAHIGQIAAMRIFDILAGQLDALLDRRQRQHKMVFADLDQQAVDDRQSQRDLEGDGRAASPHTVYSDRTAQPIDTPLDDIHPDPAPGDTGHLGGGRKAGGKDLGVDFLVGHIGCWPTTDRSQWLWREWRRGPDRRRRHGW